MKKVLVFVTNHATLGSTDQANGTYAPELTHAVHEFQNADVAYEIASIAGGAAPLYGTDVDDSVNSAVLEDNLFQQQIQNTLKASDVQAEHYDAVFYPGGFGLLSDLAENGEVAAISAALYEAGAPVGAVCHGPAGLLPITLSNGEALLADKHVTAFTREEEVDFGTIDDIPYLLEESLARNAAKYSKVAPWGEHVIVDGRLVTGQNPASAGAVAKAMLELLSA